MVQTTVTNEVFATGIPGEPARSNGIDTKGAVLNSASEANNVVGRAVKYVDGNDFEIGVAADGNFAGLLVLPKTAYRFSLAVQAYLPNDSQVTYARAGYWFVSLPATAKKGDYVYYSDTTGALITAAPDAAPTVGYTRLPGGKVEDFNVTGASVGIIYFDARSGSTETPTA